MKHFIYALILLSWFAGGCAGFLTGGGDHTVPGKKSSKAVKYMKDYKYPESIAAFQKIIEEYPNSDWAANAVYGIATAHVSAENPRKDYAQALLNFEAFLRQYPKHARAADAKNWRQAIKVILNAQKENEHLLKNIEKLKQLDMRQEQKRRGR